MWPMLHSESEYVRLFHLLIFIYHTQDCLTSPIFIDVHLNDSSLVAASSSIFLAGLC